MTGLTLEDSSSFFFCTVNLNVMWQTQPLHNVAKALWDDSSRHCVLVFKIITVISLMEVILTKGQNLKH